MIALTNARVLDVVSGRYSEPSTVRIEDDRIVSTSAPAQAADRVVDLDGDYLLPGLIDSHVHVVARTTANLGRLRHHPPHYVGAAAAQTLADSLRRGFTRVRDTGGADWGIAHAVEEGYIDGPQVYYCGRALSQTAGHGDVRGIGEACCSATASLGIGQVVDGADAVRRACREELRNGASHIKLMLSGGVASETDKVTSLQFSDAEVMAAVEEAHAVGSYVAAHAYTTEAVVRALRLGIRTIEHGNLADERAMDAIAEAGAFLVPNLVAYYRHGRGQAAAEMSTASLLKNDRMYEQGLQSLERAVAAGVKIAYGSDLLGAAQLYQSEEFELRAQVQPVIDVIRSATVVGAELLGIADHAGRVEPGYAADLCVYAADPLQEVRVLSRPAEYLRMVLRQGRVVSGAPRVADLTLS
jgi:imidazolonepropionase-like amidohydrolase